MGVTIQTTGDIKFETSGDVDQASFFNLLKDGSNVKVEGWLIEAINTLETLRMEIEGPEEVKEEKGTRL